MVASQVLGQVDIERDGTGCGEYFAQREAGLHQVYAHGDFSGWWLRINEVVEQARNEGR